MRLKITHTTEYLYDAPVPYSLQRLRLTPVDTPAQKVLSWQITVEGASVEAGYADQYGNRTELVSTEGEAHTIRIIASGEVETSDKAGVFGPHQGFCPLWLFLRETDRTKPGKLTRELARSLTGDNTLAKMHALMEAIHATVAYTPGSTDTETTAEQALEAKTGVCQDHAHIFITAARLADIPARYVSGYLLMEGQTEQVATHAWGEVHLPGLGWVGFDAANNICPDTRYVRIACGLDYADAAPISGMRLGSAGEDLKVSLTVEGDHTQTQSQNGQSQTQS
ncbi:transglutaminase-like putative cysteine protease [Neorhizobium huautlense]|uniref:Transglutaminase-like putative cysteine protease n=1 Tax=Neorhizobium huautlense TaxID=67774 RepID=A0ABT9PWY9_9HYPH|nr:transglutaminase family protein [Neorhizobium huautlense]MDP9838994.1 transglutaminase-like putative cysteine protease [Neorhizobium huautlense]